LFSFFIWYWLVTKQVTTTVHSSQYFDFEENSKEDKTAKEDRPPDDDVVGNDYFDFNIVLFERKKVF